MTTINLSAFLELVEAAVSYIAYTEQPSTESPQRERLEKALKEAGTEIGKFSGSESAEEIDVSQLIQQFANGLTSDQGDRIAKSLETLATCVYDGTISVENIAN